MYIEHKPLKSFTDDELYDILCHNEEVDIKELAAICSEILRRDIQEKRIKPKT